MKLSEAGLNLIKRFEGLSLTPYIGAGGVNAIGYGHTITQSEMYTKISEDAANGLLRLDTEEAEATIGKLIKTTLTQPQHDALCSWTFNFGYGHLRKSTLLKKINAGQHELVPTQLLRWIKAGDPPKVLLGLVRRRLAEGVMYVG